MAMSLGLALAVHSWRQRLGCTRQARAQAEQVFMESKGNGEIPLPTGGGLTADEELRSDKEPGDDEGNHREMKN
jgi:hypothetical protein